MKLGMLTACLPNRSLEQIADWAARPGYRGPGSSCVARAGQPAVHRHAT